MRSARQLAQVVLEDPIDSAHLGSGVRNAKPACHVGAPVGMIVMRRSACGMRATRLIRCCSGLTGGCGAAFGCSLLLWAARTADRAETAVTVGVRAAGSDAGSGEGLVEGAWNRAQIYRPPGLWRNRSGSVRVSERQLLDRYWPCGTSYSDSYI